MINDHDDNHDDDCYERSVSVSSWGDDDTDADDDDNGGEDDDGDIVVSVLYQ